MTELTWTTMGELVAAHLHHLTEPNEGILSKTARAVNRAIERTPETDVKAGQANKRSPST